MKTEVIITYENGKEEKQIVKECQTFGERMIRLVHEQERVTEDDYVTYLPTHYVDYCITPMKIAKIEVKVIEGKKENN